MSPPSGQRQPSTRELAEIARVVQDLQSAMRPRDRERLVTAIGKLVSLRAPMGEQWRALAEMALGHGEVTLARQAMDLFVEAQGNSPQAIYLKIALLEQAGELAEARKLMRSLPDNVPDPASNAYSLGTVALYLGDREEARTKLEQAVRHEPRHGAAWLSLSACVDLSSDAELANAIIAADGGMAGAPPQHLSPYCHALGNALAAQGEHDAAFAAFSRGAGIARGLQPYDPAWSGRAADASLTGFTAENVQAIAQRQSEKTDRAIFVTGLPRSGTTLVEQIIASHTQVSGGAEISRLPMLAGDVRGNNLPAIEACLAKYDVARPAQLWSHLLAERFPDEGRVVDKSLDTSHFIGLAASLLPDAPLIWLTRDPLDCAFSCFRTYFPAAFGWSCDLQHIAWQFRIEDRLRAHWQELLGEKLLVVPLEDLAKQPESWTRRILAHCGLPEEEGVLTPHQTERAVSTASTMQVRQPVSPSRVGSAEPYRAHMQPFLDAYYG